MQYRGKEWGDANVIRHGVSLIEVMFAIGVIVIGLLGVMAVIPVAMHQVGQGNVADFSTRAGQNAMSTFESRGMNDPALWLNASASRTPPIPPPLVAPVSFSSGTGYVIDPLFVSRNRSQSNVAIDSSLFPYTLSTATELERITLRSSFDRNDVTAATLNLYNRPLRSAQADAIFTYRDELVFELPEVQEELPTQQYDAERQFEGSYSWLATLTPIPGGTDSGYYTLSIVVFHNRDLRFFDDLNNNNTLDAAEPGLSNERIVDVDAFYGSGLGGGDVRLSASTAIDLDLQRGDWLMLMVNSVYAWYRVLDAEPEPRFNTVDSDWEIDATLAGPDWNPGSTSNPTATKAALIENIVNVYQKVTHLGPTGL
jgi:hypothetical protein